VCPPVIGVTWTCQPIDSRSFHRPRALLSHAARVRDPACAAPHRTWAAPGPRLGLAHTERAHGEHGSRYMAPPPGRGPAAHVGSQAREDPSRVAHEDEPLQGGKGERPLGFSLWKATSDYLARQRKEREVAQRPPRVGFGSGGPRVLWHHRGGPTEDLRATPYHPGHGLITQRSTRSSAASRTSNAELHSRTLCSAIARLQADAEREVRPRGSPRLQSGSRSR